MKILHNKNKFNGNGGYVFQAKGGQSDLTKWQKVMKGSENTD